MNQHHTVTYTLTKKEYQKAKKAMMKKNFKKKRVRWYLIIYLLAAILIFLLGNLHYKIFVVVLTLFGLGVQIFRIKKDRKNKQSTEMTISQGGFSIKNGGTLAKVEWKYVNEITEDADLIHLFLDKKTSVVVPKRAFSDPSEAEKFFKDAQCFWRER